MSDQQPQPIDGDTGTGETGTHGTGSAAPNVPAPGEPVEAQMLSPDQEETSPKPDAPTAEAARIEGPKMDAPNVDASNVDAPKVDAVKPEEPSFPGNVMIMPPGDRIGADAKPEAAAAGGASGKRRIGAMAAVVALATVAGALGGALATAGVGKLIAGDSASASAPAKESALEASVARIDADIAALKARLEQTTKTGVTQFNKTSDRLDKVEKAQAEPAAKLAKLSEAVDKLRSAQASAPPAPAKEVTGSVSQPAAAAAAPPKPEVARLPTVGGWVLRDVANGSALIEGRRGLYEVYAGDPVPGLGRVDAIRKQDGRWVVVTSKGLIVAR